MEAPRELSAVLNRVRCNLPLINAAKLDGLFRCYLLQVLVEMQSSEGKAVPVPASATVERV